MSAAADWCVAGQPAFTNETITGVRVYVTVSDAATAGARAVAGICAYASGRTVIGRIYVSTALQASTPEAMRAVMKHELGHLFGVPSGELVSGVPGPDPRFLGAEARRQFVLAGGVD